MTIPHAANRVLEFLDGRQLLSTPSPASGDEHHRRLLLFGSAPHARAAAAHAQLTLPPVGPGGSLPECAKLSLNT